MVKYYKDPFEAPHTQPPIGLLHIGAVLENDGHKQVLGFIDNFYLDKDNARIEINFFNKENVCLKNIIG